MARMEALGPKNLATDIHHSEVFADGTGVGQLVECLVEAKCPANNVMGEGLPMLLLPETRIKSTHFFRSTRPIACWGSMEAHDW